MKILDTLSKEKKVLDISKPLSFYQCGPTMYWHQHIGNMRAVVMADVMIRTLHFLDAEVTFVRNYTDVGHLTSDGDGGEDKMEKAVKRDAKTPEEIFQVYKETYLDDIKSLNTLEPTHAPRATEHIQEMIDLVSTLLEKNIAYQTEHAIYFDISKQADYTKLSGQNIDKLLSGSGHGDIVDESKKNRGDFSLWFFKSGTHEHAIQTWNNPFSEKEGFPGWHIECSAMAHKYLGQTINIHMGGIEHIPIHHTNEIAQSESGYGSPFVDIWVHNEHLLVDGKKMSKSEGTSYLISDIIERGYSSLDLRYMMLQAHYRSKQNFTWDALEAAKKARTSILNKFSGMDTGSISEEYVEKFTATIEDDFNTPQALAVVHEMFSSNISEEDKLATLVFFDEVLGLDIENQIKANSNLEISDEIQKLLEKRQSARESKEWNLSDKLREEIEALGYLVKDGADGQTITKK